MQSVVQVECCCMNLTLFWYPSMLVSVCSHLFWRMVGAVSHLMCIDRIWKMPFDRGDQSSWDTWSQALFRSPFLGRSPCVASSAVHREGCLVAQDAAADDVVVSGSTSNDPPCLAACMQDWNCGFHLPYSPRSHRCRTLWFKRGGRVLLACAKEL